MPTSTTGRPVDRDHATSATIQETSYVSTTADPQAAAEDLDLVTAPLPTALDGDSFTPRLITLLSNALVANESRALRSRFELGTNEWRIVSALGLRPGSSASEVSEYLAVNKAAISRGTAILVRRRLIRLVDGPRGSRPMYLTQAGAEMHDQMLPISMRGQRMIEEELGPENLAVTNALLHRLIDAARSRDPDDPTAAVGSAR
jgi:DNA-binding MarR family transcriptional regulator